MIRNLDNILSQVSKLNKSDQAILLKKISNLVNKKEGTTATIKLTQLSGLGAPVWQNIDIDNYIDSERQW
jgi:hypothetical protein